MLGWNLGTHRSVKQNLKPRKRPKYDNCSISNQIKWYSKHKSKEVKTWNMKTGTTKKSPLNGFLTETHTHKEKTKCEEKNLIRQKKVLLKYKRILKKCVSLGKHAKS